MISLSCLSTKLLSVHINVCSLFLPNYVKMNIRYVNFIIYIKKVWHFHLEVFLFVTTEKQKKTLYKVCYDKKSLDLQCHLKIILN